MTTDWETHGACKKNSMNYMYRARNKKKFEFLWQSKSVLPCNFPFHLATQLFVTVHGKTYFNDFP